MACPELEHALLAPDGSVHRLLPIPVHVAHVMIFSLMQIALLVRVCLV